MKTLHTALIASLGILSISGIAQAANVRIDDSNPNGTITISWVDFENGFTVNGTNYGSGGSVTVTPTTTPALTFSGGWLTNGGTGSTKTLYFVDAGTTHVRDALSVTSSGPAGFGNASINGTFSSDVPTDLGTAPAGSTTIALSGGSQELVGYLGLPANLTFQVVGKAFTASALSPINPNGSSVFRAGRGVIPIKFALAFGGTPLCNLPPATISVQNISSGAPQSVDESTYTMQADTGSNFRIDQQACQYVYNLSASSLAAGTYQVNILFGTAVVGSATFGIQ